MELNEDIFLKQTNILNLWYTIHKWKLFQKKNQMIYTRMYLAYMHDLYGKQI
jgi:hypothetical protein